MNSFLAKILTNIPKAIKEPNRAARIIRKRVFPFEAMAKDPEAYQMISSWTFGAAPRAQLADIFQGIETVDVNIVRAFDREPTASLNAAELLSVAAIINHTKPEKILEIGTFDGNTTINLAANSPDGATVTTVDLPQEWEGDLGLEVPDHMVNVTGRMTVGSQIRDTEHSKKIKQVFGDSATMNWSDLNGPFNLIFIDGCHYYDYVKSDTINAVEHLADGGTILWHDYGIVEDVSRAVDEVANRFPVSAIRGTRIAVGFPKR